MGDLIYLDQTLHGYADGHQLLATSTDLTPEQQSALLIMSDLSGPAFRAGYETYVTGYPSSGGATYCLARTWFAPELPRPGCVWTQTLLIKAEDLARIRNFDHVNGLFKRPTGSSETGGYCRRLPLEQESNIVSKLSVDGRAILAALYDSNKKIVISSESSRSFETILFAVFEQQWPRLRRSFRFCSGALSLRDTEFDISVSPPEATHSLSREGVLISKNAFNEPSEQWLEIANRDLVNREISSSFRDFLWRFGPDFLEGRRAFRPLSEIYFLLSQRDLRDSLERTFSAIAHFYPEPNDAPRLKEAMFGIGKDRLSLEASDAAVLKLLVSHPAASAISVKTANMRVRGVELAKSDLSSAVEIAALAQELGGEHGQVFLDGLFENSEWSADFLARVPVELLANLLSRHPTILSRSSLWLRSDRVDLIARFSSQIMSDSDLLRGTISSMMEADAWDALSKLISYGDDSVVGNALSAIDSSNSISIDYPDALYSDLARRNETWLKLAQENHLGPRALKFLSAELDPRSYYVRRLNLKSWSEALSTDFQFNSPFRRLRSSIFALSVGLSSWNDEAAVLVADGFSLVYSAAAANRIDEPLWQQLEPSLSWYSPSWDRCARLVRTVAHAFKDRSWPLQQFFLTFKSNHELARALLDINESYGGKRFIRGAQKSVLDGVIKLSEEQAAILDSM